MADDTALAQELSTQNLVHWFLKKGVLLSSDVLHEKELLPLSKEELLEILISMKRNHISVLTKDLLFLYRSGKAADFHGKDLEALRYQRETTKQSTGYEKMLALLKEEKFIAPPPPPEPTEQEVPSVEILFNYKENQKKREVMDFVAHYNARYTSLRSFLMRRQEVENLISISNLKKKKERETVSIIGIVSDVRFTKNHNLMMTLEDPTGTIHVMVNKNKPDLFQQCRDIVHDEVIAVIGVPGDNVLFSTNVLWPDVPMVNELKKAEKEEYAVFFSDIHVGSKFFLREEFMKAINWLRGEIGNEEQKRIASLGRYVFVVGDLVDGVGVYPGQETELTHPDIYQQYEECAQLLSLVPGNKVLIISPGNHDALRLAEPQPKLGQDVAKLFYEMKNARLCTNPSLVNIAATPHFEGFNILLYHGYSYDYYAQNVDSLREQKAYDKPDTIMRFLLRKRHLAPVHTSTLFIPDVDHDYLVIDKVPDIFVSGHIHTSSVSLYRNVQLICSSCWQDTTPFQEKVGHHPTPARLPIINLKTREIKILKFTL